MNQGKFYPRASNQNLKFSKTQALKVRQSKMLPIKNSIQNSQSQSSATTREPQTQSQCCSNPKIKDYFKSWLLFIIAFLVFLLIWVIGHFSIERLTDYYYFSDYNVSPNTSLDLWTIWLTNTVSGTYFISNNWYTIDELKRADSIALALFFSWIMWKLPLTVFTLSVIKQKGSSLQKYSTYGFFLVLLLLIDIMATVFRPQGYQDWIFFVIYVGLSIVLIVANSLKNRKKLPQNIKNFILPIIYITLAYVSFSLLIPGIYHAIYHNLAEDAPYVIAHLFPAIDLIFYSLIVMMTYICDPHTIKFIKMFQFLNIGYAVGHVLLFSPEDVEFYYMVGYLAVRNLAFNWVHGRVQKYVIIPCAQPAWLMIYLVSLCINFIPFVGFGKLVISRSFYSQILQLTVPIQSYYLPTDYYANNPSTLPQYSTFNPGLKSNISISSIFIIWVVTNITQKYHISGVEFKQVFFYVFGVYMFYFGLATGVQLEFLQANSL